MSYINTKLIIVTLGYASILTGCNSGGKGLPEKDQNGSNRVVVKIEQCSGAECVAPKPAQTEITLSAEQQCQEKNEKVWIDGLCISRSLSNSRGDSSSANPVTSVTSGTSGTSGTGTSGGGTSTGGSGNVGNTELNIKVLSGETSQQMSHGDVLKPIIFTGTNSESSEIEFLIASTDSCPSSLALSENTLSGLLQYQEDQVLEGSLPSVCKISIIGKTGDIKSEPVVVSITINSGFFSTCVIAKRTGQSNSNVNLIQKRLDQTDCADSAKALETVERLDFRCSQTGYREPYYNEARISDLSLLKSARSLRMLCVRSNAVRKLVGIEKLVKLESLTISGDSIESGPKIRDFEALKSLKNLRNLKLWAVRGVTAASLGGLTSLETLDLSFNMLTDISALGSLGGLQSLILSGNQIKDVSGLRNLALLEEFSILGSPLDIGTRTDSVCSTSSQSEVLREYCSQ